MLVEKKKGRVRRFLGATASIIFLAVSLVFAFQTWTADHTEHGHASMLLEDPAHLFSLILAGAGGVWAWKSVVSLLRKR